MTDKEICKRLDFIISYCTNLKIEIENKKPENIETDTKKPSIYNRTDNMFSEYKPKD